MTAYYSPREEGWLAEKAGALHAQDWEMCSEGNYRTVAESARFRAHRAGKYPTNDFDGPKK